MSAGSGYDTNVSWEIERETRGTGYTGATESTEFEAAPGTLLGFRSSARNTPTSMTNQMNQKDSFKSNEVFEQETFDSDSGSGEETEFGDAKPPKGKGKGRN